MVSNNTHTDILQSYRKNVIKYTEHIHAPRRMNPLDRYGVKSAVKAQYLVSLLHLQKLGHN